MRQPAAWKRHVFRLRWQQVSLKNAACASISAIAIIARFTRRSGHIEKTRAFCWCRTPGRCCIEHNNTRATARVRPYNTTALRVLYGRTLAVALERKAQDDQQHTYITRVTTHHRGRRCGAVAAA